MSQFKYMLDYEFGTDNYDPGLLLLKLAADEDGDGVVTTSDYDDLMNRAKV